MCTSLVEQDKTNPYISRFLSKKRKYPEPVGFHFVNSISQAISTAEDLTPQNPLIFLPTVGKNVVNGVKSCIVIDLRNVSSVKEIHGRIVILITPKKCVIEKIDCTHLIVIGGEKLTIKNITCAYATFYGTSEIMFYDTEVYQSLCVLSDYVRLCGKNQITRMFIIANQVDIKTKLSVNGKYVLGINNLDLRKLVNNTTLIDTYPGLYIADSALIARSPDSFKFSMETFHRKLDILIWTAAGISPSSVEKDHPIFTQCDDPIDFTVPYYINLSNFIASRNIYAYYLQYIHDNQFGDETSAKDKTKSMMLLRPACIKDAIPIRLPRNKNNLAEYLNPYKKKPIDD